MHILWGSLHALLPWQPGKSGDALSLRRIEMARVEINLVAAVEQSGGIGKDGGLPWSLPQDWEHFLRLATRFVILLFLLFCWPPGLKIFYFCFLYFCLPQTCVQLKITPLVARPPAAKCTHLGPIAYCLAQLRHQMIFLIVKIGTEQKAQDLH